MTTDADTLRRNVDLRLVMLGKNLAWIARLLKISRSAICKRHRKDVVDASSIQWWSSAVALPPEILCSQDPADVVDHPLPPPGWEDDLVTGLDNQSSSVDTTDTNQPMETDA